MAYIGFERCFLVYKEHLGYIQACVLIRHILGLNRCFWVDKVHLGYIRHIIGLKGASGLIRYIKGAYGHVH